MLHARQQVSQIGKAFIDWSDKLDATKYTMSSKLEESDIQEGSDLADLIVNSFS